MTTRVNLNDRLDYQTMPRILADLKAVEDDELILDAADVRHLGALSLQLILATIKTRAAQGKTTVLNDPSDSCVDMLRLFGFTPETLTQPEAWT